MKPVVVTTSALLGMMCLSGCMSRTEFRVLDAYPASAERTPVEGEIPGPAGEACRNEWLTIDRVRHRYSSFFDRGHDVILADVSNCGTETIYVTISAEVCGPKHTWWTQAGGAYLPPGTQKRVSTTGERTRDHRFTGIARINARPENGACANWRYIEVDDCCD